MATRQHIPTVSDDNIRSRLIKLSPAKMALLETRLHDLAGEQTDTSTIVQHPDRTQAPLSSGQARLWFINQMNGAGPAYLITLYRKIFGPLNPEMLRFALSDLVHRHEVLRTSYISENGKPVQKLHKPHPVELPVIDLSGNLQEAVRIAVEESRKPIDLEHDLMLRAKLIRVSTNEHWLLLTMHHIASDGWSSEITLRELSEFYQARLAGRDPVLAALPIQYADYAIWQKEWLHGADVEKQLAYWRKKLADAPPLLNLPSDRPRAAVQSFRGATHIQELSRPLVDALEELRHREGVSLFMLLVAAFQTFLYRVSGQEDILLGSPIAGRHRDQTEGLIGFFVNTLVLRTVFSGEPTFHEVLRRVRETCLDAFENQDLPFEKVVEALHPERNAGYSPLFQVLFALQGADTQAEFHGLTIEDLEIDNATSKVDLTLFITQHKDGMRACIEYSTDLFERQTIERLAGYFVNLLQGIVADPSQRVSELPILSPSERNQLLVEWNNTQRDYPRDKTIHELFENQVRRTPDAIAAVLRDKHITYSRLNERADILATRLRAFGVGPDTRVAICMERSIEMLCGLLAILKAGGCYVPLDPEYPKDMLAFMLADCQPPVILTSTTLARTLPPHGARVICLDQPLPEVPKEETKVHQPKSKVTPDHLAYIIYTSGSTGQPRGIEIPHRGIVRLLFGAQYVDLGADKVFLHLSPISFDASTFEVWGPLLHGGQCILFPDRIPTVRDLGAAIEKHGVTTLWLTAQLFNTIIDVEPGILRGVRQLFTGGEALSVRHVRQALSILPGTRLVNGYGPTECTTFACTHPISRLIPPEAVSVPIGKPIPNTQVYVLDSHMNPAPIGVPGELYIGGDGLARGYLNRPELTEARFVPNPFLAGTRLYKTGDRVRWLADGTIDFLGRTDFQVKVRGYRIELGEIECALSEHPSVKENVVTARELSPTTKSIVAYVVPKNGYLIQQDELRNHLKLRFPEYMIPAAFVSLPRLPLSPNGKVNRKALPSPSEVPSQRNLGYVAPRAPVEELLCKIWAEVLGVGKVGIHDNFFELGGHSLLSLQIINQINRAGLRVTVAQFFQHPTIAALASVVTTAPASQNEEDWSSLVALRPRGTKPPFFLVHTAPGDVLCYINLVSLLGEDQPCYGFQSHGHGSPAQAHRTIEEMAAHYVALLRKFQPQGPYYLGGWCFGGAVAMEMANQLLAQGQRIGILALFETDARRPVTGLPQFYLGRLRAFFRMSFARKVQYVREKLRSLYTQLFKQAEHRRMTENRFGFSMAHGALANREEVYRINIRASKLYRSRPYHGPIWLFNAESVGPERIPDPSGGFETLVYHIEVHPVPGEHMSVLQEPHVRVLAEKLKTCLKEAQAIRG